ncbi:hypothetical protein G4B88_010917 [Cannabis sativa]|uniref:Uncharacterized protein n=1 Tax=Cannabis sativa TaxID=3483 RepID=A0A7J6HJM6_CANSA|nr:hypothetical protein G4B88_010917 [Cannabis sativa]
MVNAGNLNFLLTIQSTTTTTTTTASSFLFFPHKTHLNHFLSNWKNPSSPFSNGLCYFSTHLKFSSVNGRRRTGSRLFSSKKKQGKQGVEFLEMEGFDDDDIDINDEEEEDDDGSIILPLEKMNKWLENKPRGFGVEKVYDTSIEDKLLEELEQARVAQAANLNKLKKDTNPNSDLKKDEEQKKKGNNEIPPNGIRVRVSNLPKKKNVHRDLSSAFKGVPGMICINAMKQIKCEIINSKTSESSLTQSSSNTYGVPPLKVKAESLGEVQIADSDTDTNDSSPNEWEKSSYVETEDVGDELLMSELEDGMENLNLVNALENNSSDKFEEGTESESRTDDNSVSSEVETIRALEKKLLAKLGKEGKAGPKKKLAAKAKGEKASKKKQVVKTKEAIPGSAKRLKVREKAVLNDVISKYTQKSSIDSKEKSLVSGM